MAARWIVERLNPAFAYAYRAGRTLHTGRTAFQDLEVIDSEEFGHTLLLDGVTQVNSRNEFLYHEPMVHPALVAHPLPREVLVIGGGDGGILREVLRHRTVERAVLAELDPGVIDFCARHLSEVSAGAFADPRTRTVIGDGRAFVEGTDERFDAVIMDMTDPFGPSAMLYTEEFFRAVKRIFRDEDGVFVMHTESPISRPRTFQQCLHTLARVFRFRRTFYLYIPMYGVLWSITVASDRIDAGALAAAEIDARLAGRAIGSLRCYTGATHHAMLTPMPFIADLVEGARALPWLTDAAPRVLDDIDINREGSLRLSES